MHDDIGDAAGRNDIHHSVSDVYITSMEKQHNRTIVLNWPLLLRGSTRAGPLQRQKLIYPATAHTPCRNYRLGDNSSESIPESLLSLSRAALPDTDDHAAHPFRVSSASQLNRVNDAAPAPPEPEPRMPPGCCLVSGERRFRSMALRILQSLSASQIISTPLLKG
jgi:hypothetical protein